MVNGRVIFICTTRIYEPGVVWQARAWRRTHLPPALGLSNRRPFEGARRRVLQVQLVLPVLAPLDEELAGLRAVPGGARLELGCEEFAIGTQVHLKVAARVLEVVYANQLGNARGVG